MRRPGRRAGAFSPASERGGVAVDQQHVDAHQRHDVRPAGVGVQLVAESASITAKVDGKLPHVAPALAPGRRFT